MAIFAVVEAVISTDSNGHIISAISIELPPLIWMSMLVKLRLLYWQ
jgi:hypothetical protein